MEPNKPAVVDIQGADKKDLTAQTGISVGQLENLPTLYGNNCQFILPQADQMFVKF